MIDEDDNGKEVVTTFFGFTSAEIIALRDLYFCLGGEIPISEGNIRRLVRAYSGAKND